jgi:hypothetical protein
MYQETSADVFSEQTTLPTTDMPDIPCETVDAEAVLKVTVPIMIESLMPTVPCRKVLFRVSVGFYV